MRWRYLKMKLNKRIITKDKDRFNRDREKILELRITENIIDLKETELDELVKFLCIAVKCNNSCKECMLKNEKSLVEYMKKSGVTDGWDKTRYKWRINKSRN